MRLPTSGLLPTIRRPLSMIWKSPEYGPVTVSSLTWRTLATDTISPLRTAVGRSTLSSNRPLPV